MLAVLASAERNPKLGVLLPAEIVEVGRKAGVPVLIDAASELSPESIFHDLWRPSAIERNGY